ncbi:ABC transporter ATP-binding protein [Gorillibacterium timonense]|uniref:ABC transporter ATP-binding protein n=1 Tax=Gorillibacterium timonense TaxID=1689269 RepID=UPI00071D4741|nr:ABC transporter ATP-binding protein [Gorillibacterium timonense]
MNETLLKVDNLVTHFSIRGKPIPAVRGVSLEVKKGKTLVVLGESGSGKSVMLRSILRILPKETVTSGQVLYNGEELLHKSEKEMQRIRGSQIAMVFQDSLSALDPLYRVGEQIGECMRDHGTAAKGTIRGKVTELLTKVGIPSPETRMRAYPFEMSGGMRQRSVIGMSLANTPQLLLADEPTTALDVTIQAQILTLFKQIQREYGMTVILVTHDIGVAIEMADEIAVMYAGKIVEYGDVSQVLGSPAHPYTKGLIEATPRPGQREELTAIPGQPPSIANMPAGCAFAERCRWATERCRAEQPEYISIGGGHYSACHLTESSTA